MIAGTKKKVMITDPTGKIHLHQMDDPVVDEIINGPELLILDFNDNLFLICAHEDIARVGSEFYLFGKALISGLDEEDSLAGVTDEDINDTIIEMTKRLTTARLGGFCFPVVHLTSVEVTTDDAGRN